MGLRQTILIAAGAVTIVVQVATMLAMVIAPACTGIGHRADIYRIASLCTFIPAWFLLAYRRGSIFAAILIPAAQIACGIGFAEYLDSLPLQCS